MLRDNLQKRFTAKWWENRPVDQKDLDYILECAYLAPSKQCLYNYKILVFTDSDFGRQFKNWLYWDNTWCLNTQRNNSDAGIKRYNGQVLAPIFLLWMATDMSPDTNKDCMVSATVAMLAAEELGLQTGFCGCVGPNEIKERLHRSESAIVGLGIGSAVPDNQLKRSIFKDGMEVGFDLSNTDPKLTNARDRIRKPSFKNLVTYY